ncbi:IS1380 family transposase [Candidatus Neomicrothrix sp.]|uniref:IS1380 family transposase n=1 Tax=Candidatus Neomicrothrix sp. TaxID=2719034 RepID=UPI001B565029|nr:IS1380 family transposase [Candidatus Microthrix sp.]MBP6149667.1 IS1380 family transposase [Candidatus Microthrix sp.]
MRNRMDAYWRAANGSTRKALGFVPLAPSTIGTFLRSFKFGHVRQLDAVNSRLLANAWAAGAGPKPDEELVVDLDSTVTEVYGKQKQGASYGYTGVLGYHPLIATRAGTGEVLGSRMRKGAAGSSRGVLRFIGEVLATIGRAGVCGPVTVRADSGFWSWKLIDKLTKAGVGWSITVRLVPKIKTTIAAIPEEAWTTIDYTPGGHAQVAETIYTTGKGKQVRHVRLVVRRTRLADTAQAAMWPTWRHHAFICNNTLTTVEADRFHRNHAVVELAIRELKDNGLEHCPSGSFAANGAWLACAVLAHNLTRWTGIIGLDGPIRTARTIRNRIIALAGALVNRSGTPTLRLPTDWPWAHQFHAALTTIRALPTAGPP